MSVDLEEWPDLFGGVQRVDEHEEDGAVKKQRVKCIYLYYSYFKLHCTNSVNISYNSCPYFTLCYVPSNL
jgi:hypothetical protein